LLLHRSFVSREQQRFSFLKAESLYQT
jgi:hypothetical protein